jgi:hypothetical protein
MLGQSGMSLGTKKRAKRTKYATTGQSLVKISTANLVEYPYIGTTQ